ncbi:MAG: hypothetical protein BGO30_07080 [Bacteroidetes bacterium 41-46]|nr:MAG: hypothetical protein BGO30_07080 [Bacteroidetes bacterium 41-46]
MPDDMPGDISGSEERIKNLEIMCGMKKTSPVEFQQGTSANIGKKQLKPWKTAIRVGKCCLQLRCRRDNNSLYLHIHQMAPLRNDV